MSRAFALAGIVAALLACTGDPPPRRPAEPAPPAPAPASASGAALPADRQCLPASICERWAGCALVTRADPHWKVVAADEFPAGELVDVKDLCPEATCIAAVGIPRGAPCPDLRTPILVKPPT